MLNKVFRGICIALIISIPVSLWAGGKKEFGGQEAQGLDNWSSRVDLTGKKPGEYNLIIEAKDHAGNITIAGPFNIFVDPESDVPVVSITNPIEGMRVGTNLNIVGIAVDDDSVKKVEVSLDGGAPVTAEGADYWSYYLKVADIPDGRHTISVTAYDVKDIPSKPVSVSFNLDKFKPVNTVSSHENGVLVSGQINVLGSVNDANGVAKLGLSEDGGKTYSQVNVAESREGDSVSFSIPIDTKRLSDGPHVYWLRSVDKTGSVGVSAFLLNVDNTAPKISVLSPALDQSVNGRVAVAGIVSDQVGINSLSWEFGKEKGEFELIPGNPFFFKVFDLSNETSPNTQVIIRSTDRAGNLTELRYPIKIDLNADLPVLSLSEPADKAVLGQTFKVAGQISDDDSVSKIHYQIDNEKEVVLAAAESFGFELSGIGVGAHKISFWAEDGNGVQGKKIERSVSIRGAAPAVTLQNAQFGRSPAGLAGKPIQGVDAAVFDSKITPASIPFVPGLLVLADGKNTIFGSIKAGNAIKSAEFSLGEGAAKSLSLKNGQDATEKTFEIVLPNDIGFGIVPVSVKVKDSFEQESTVRSFVFVLNYAKINEEPAIVISDTGLSADGVLRLDRDRTLVAAVVGVEAKSVKLVPASSLVGLELDGKRILIRAVGQGPKFSAKIVVVSDKGHETASSELSFVTDFDGPKIELAKPAASSWLAGETMTVEGSLSDSTPVASLEYSLDGAKNFQVLDLAKVLKPGTGVRAFSAEVPLSTAPQGAFVFVLRAKDDSGNTTDFSTVYQYDRLAPELAFLFPPELGRVASQVPVLARINERQSLASLQYRLGEGAWQSLEVGPIALFGIPAPSGAPVKLTVQATDAAGNIASVERDIQPAPEAVPVSGPVADPKTGRLPEPLKPEAELVYPGPNDKLGSQARILLKFNNLSDAYSKITLQPEGGKAVVVSLAESSPYLVHDLDLRSSRAASVNLNVLFEGAQNRRQTQTLKLNVDLNLDKPTISLVQAGSGLAVPATTANDQNKTLRISQALFAFSASDRVKNGDIRYAVDGGAELKAIGDSSALVRLDSLAPGAHKIDYWAVNSAGNASAKQTLNFVLLGPAPLVSIQTLVKGKSSGPFADMQSLVLADETRLSGQITAGNQIANLEYRLNTAEFKKLNPTMKGAVGSFEIPIGKDLPWGRNLVTVKATDQLGLATEHRVSFFRVADQHVSTKDEPGIYLDLQNPNGNFDLALGDTVYARFVGRPVAKVELIPPSALLNVDFENSLLRLRAISEGISAPVKLVVTDVDGDQYRSADIRFFVDIRPPIVQLESPSQASWVRDSVSFAGTVTENLGLRTLGYRISPSTEIVPIPFQIRALPSPSSSPAPAPSPSPSVPSPAPASRSPTAAAAVRAPSPSPVPSPSPSPSPSPAAFLASLVDIAPVERTYIFQTDIDLSGLPEGAVNVEIVAEDESANVTVHRVSLSRDVTAPVVGQITPPNGTEINGKIIVIGSVSDAGRVVGVEFSDNNKDWSPVVLDGLLSFQIDFSAYKQLPESFVIRATDAAGNVQSFSPSFNVNQKLDLPVVEIQTPLENEVQRSDFRLTGVAYDDDAVKAVYYRIDYKEPAPSPSPSATPSPSPSIRPTPAPVTGRPGATGPVAAPSPSPSPALAPSPSTSPSPVPTIAPAPDLATFTKVESTGNISIPFKIMEIGDNEHVVEIVAEDVNGVIGEVKRRVFRVSTAEPTSLMSSPETRSTERGIITVTGSASDNNGIRDVALSFDNGVSFVRAQGAESWSYVLDTRTLKDGTHSVIIRTNDKYDTEGLFSTLVTVDNTAPKVSLDLPADGQVASGKVFISGRLSDGIGLAGLKLSIVPADQPVSARKDEIALDLPIEPVLAQEIDVAALKPGWYTLRLEAKDRADNFDWVSRDFRVTEAAAADKVEMIYPVEGATLSGLTTVSGRVTARTLPENIALYIDKQLLASLPVNKQGFFSMDLGPVALENGPHVIEAQLGTTGGNPIGSVPRSFDYQREGPWVRFASVKNGDFVNKRPILDGLAGWNLPEPPKEDTETHATWERGRESRNIDKVQMSLDNGRTYQDLPVEFNGSWRYRLETQNFPDGDLYLLVRATFRDGSVASDHIVLVVDETPPVLQVIKPGEEGRFNEILDIAGIASDNNELAQIRVDLRQGNKAAYEVPSFIQGMYIDAHFLGATTWEAGLGLTFFDDNVKLQVGVGQAPEDERIEGLNIHAKLIASILKLPFSYLFGPDLDFLSASLAVGAQFSYFTNNKQNEFNADSKIVAGALAQLEFPKIYISDWDVLRSYALYTEFEIWFIPSDVATPSAPNVIPRLSFGARIGLF